MTTIAYAPGPNGWDTYQVTLVNSHPPAFAPTNRDPDSVVIPGFIDLHIHGAFGIDFMSATTDDLISLAEHLAAEGYAGFLPTTITSDFHAVSHAVKQLPDHPLILGFHLEGPFISPIYPGAQPPSAITPIPPPHSQWEELFTHPGFKLITLAPELENALPLIKQLTRQGVIVSAGHTDATYDQINAAVDAGLSHATHTYNAMRPFHHREPGTVGAALTIDSISTELIYDRHHVARPAAELLIKAKPTEQVIAVSDCTLAKGQPTGATFNMWGHQVTKGQDDVRITESGTLAGSCATLLDCFRNLAQDFDLKTATQLCCLNPMRKLRITRPARWILLDLKTLTVQNQP
jgi:N-acetylglucosamine-6-phosphate deacetylase